MSHEHADNAEHAHEIPDPNDPVLNHGQPTTGLIDDWGDSWWAIHTHQPKTAHVGVGKLRRWWARQVLHDPESCVVCRSGQE